MLSQTQSREAFDHTLRLTAQSPSISAEHHQLFRPFAGTGGLEPYHPVAKCRTFVSPLASGILRSVVVEKFLSYGVEALYKANNRTFLPCGMITVHIGEGVFDADTEPAEPWVRSVFQYDIAAATEPNNWKVNGGVSAEGITSEFCRVAADQLEYWGIQAQILGQEATKSSIELSLLPDYEYNVNYQLSELE